MLKKMRRRMILAAMLAFFAVIMMIAILVNLVNYAVVTDRCDRTLSAILTYESHSPSQKPDPKDPPPPREPFMGLPDVEQNYMTRFFTVRFDANENVIFASTDNIASVDEQDAVSYAREVLRKGKEHGYMKEYRFAMAETGDATVVVFLNTGREQQSMKALMVLTLIISFISLLIVFVLVALLSKRAIRPIANNIRMQKQFITDASHELKTPLTSISTSLDVITMERGEDEWTENIRTQTKRMSKLVGELVTLSRLDEEMPLPDKERFSLTTAAWEIVDVYLMQAKAEGKHFDTDIAEDVFLFGDKASIQQMLSVLLDNAIRYSDAEADIRFCVAKKKNHILIEVFNTCQLSSVPDVDRLFDRFYRPDASRSTHTGGSGVGLSIAKAVVEAHDGEIVASCPSGKSVTIRIRLK